jgi:hypothetical protein
MYDADLHIDYVARGVDNIKFLQCRHFFNDTDIAIKQ